MKAALVYLIAFCIIIVLIYGVFLLNKKFNAWMYYNGATESIICDMVKPEALTPYGQALCVD